jgi:hypothetical protein
MLLTRAYTGKAFFSEEKKQKTFGSLPRVSPDMHPDRSSNWDCCKICFRFSQEFPANKVHVRVRICVTPLLAVFISKSECHT